MLLERDALALARRSQRRVFGNSTATSAQETIMEPFKSTSEPNISRDAKELASDVVGRAKELAGEQVSDRREKSAGAIGKLAEALHHTSEEDTVAAPYIEKAADMLDRLSGSVRDTSLRDAVRATERFARREPLVFLGGAFIVGLLASRFLKSSGRAEIEIEREENPGGMGRP